MRKIILNIILIFCVIPAINAQDIKIPVNYFKAINCYNQQKPDSALDRLGLCNDDPYCILLNAQILFEAGNYSGSAALYRTITDKLPSEASFGLAVIYAEMGFADESVAWLKKHFESKNPKSYSEINSLEAFSNISRSEEWREFWDNPGYPKNYEKLAEAKYLIKNGNYFETVDLLDAQNFGSRNYIKHQLLAEAYYANGNTNAALQNIESSLSENPDYPESLRLKAEINKKNSNFQVYYETSLDLLKNEPYNPENLFGFAESCLSVNKKQEALTYINIYLDCFPESENANYFKVKILCSQEDYRNALISLNKLISVNSSEKEYFILRGDIYFLLESWKFASDDYSMALDIYPLLPEVYLNLGICQQNLNMPEKACHSWKKAASMKNREAAEMLFKYCGN